MGPTESGEEGAGVRQVGEGHRAGSQVRSISSGPQKQSITPGPVSPAQTRLRVNTFMFQSVYNEIRTWRPAFPFEKVKATLVVRCLQNIFILS